MLESLTSAHFLEHVGSTFQFHYDAERSMPVELLDVVIHRLGGGTALGRRESFSLLFRGPTSFRVPQRIYTLEHAVLGSLEIFLVPIGPDDQGMRYEAVFN
jgi:hypothetical protein